MERAELVSRLRVALKNLSSRCTQLITLRYLEELSFKEIGEIVGSSENTVTVQTRRCLDSLRLTFDESDKRGSRQ